MQLRRDRGKGGVELRAEAVHDSDTSPRELLLSPFFGGPGRWRIAKVYFAHSIRLKPMCRFFISASYAQACLRQSG